MIIKFRAWNNINNKMIQAEDLAFEAYRPLYLNFLDRNLIFEPFTQYYDDDGNEIYLGDIIEITKIKDNVKITIQTEIEWNDESKEYFFSINNDKDSWNNEAYMFELPDNKKENYHTTFETCKIIGNKHEGVKQWEK